MYNHPLKRFVYKGGKLYEKKYGRRTGYNKAYRK